MSCNTTGDSIAVGIAEVLKGCSANAKVGIPSAEIVARAAQAGDVDFLIISAGSNDFPASLPASQVQAAAGRVTAALDAIHAAKSPRARMILVIPANGARATVETWNKAHPDVIAVRFEPGADGIHPRSYGPLANAVLKVMQSYDKPMAPGAMRVSAAGRKLLTQREGKRLAAYRDSVGVWTIGVGHTGRMAPPPVSAGMSITDAQSDAFLEADLGPVERALNAVLKARPTQNQFDAMASWLFNVGVGYARPSTRIIARLNAGDVQGAAAGFDLFHIPAVIIGRRNGEKAQFLRPDVLGAADGARPHPAPAIPPLKPEPALAGSPPAPASVSPAAKDTTAKDTSIMADTKTATITVKPDDHEIDFFQGVKDMFGGIASNMIFGANAIESPKVATGTPDIGTDIGDLREAGKELLEIVGDAGRKDVMGGLDDAVDLMRVGFRFLARRNVKVPIVSDVIQSIDLNRAS